MDLVFIKKEEPVDYDLILTNEDEKLITKNESAISDIYAIKEEFKDEPADSYIDDGSSEYSLKPANSIGDRDNVEETVYSDKDGRIVKNLTKSKSSKPKKDSRLICNQCSASFTKKYRLRRHLKRHKDKLDNEYCPICKRFQPKSAIEFHMAMHKEPPYICPTCGKEFTIKDSFRGHRKIHRKSEHECDICQKRFITKSNLRVHRKSHIDIDREKKLHCQICEGAFLRKSSLLRHIRVQHLVGPKRKFKCSIPSCNREFTREHTLKNHKCSQTSSQTVEKRKRKAKVSNPSNPSKSPNTSRRETKADENRLSTHLGAHAKQPFLVEKPNHFNAYKCDFCGKIFERKYWYLKHMNERCTLREYFVTNTSNDGMDPDRFECDLCGSVFMHKGGIAEHMKIMHWTRSFDDKELKRNFTCSMNQAYMLQYSCCDQMYLGGALNLNHVATEECHFMCSCCVSLYANLYLLFRHCAEICMVKGSHSLYHRHMMECKSCDEMFKWSQSIPEHFKCVD